MYKKGRVAMVCCVLSCLLFFCPQRKGLAEEVRSSVGPVLGYLNGNTTYHISYYEGSSGIESELEFPLKTILGGIGFSFEEGGLILDGLALTNIDQGHGKVKDSDWLSDDLDIQETGQVHPGKDIYSESPVDLRAYLFDIDLKSRYDFSWYEVLPKVGFAYQHFDFVAYDTHQVGYGPYNTPSYTVNISGKSLEYRIDYFILYLGPEMRLKRGGLSLGIGLYYCPYVYASDRDDHVLRAKLARAEADGTGYMASMDLRWQRPKGGLSIDLKTSYKEIRARGTQTQTFYDGPYAGQSFEVNDRITSKQFLFMASLLWNF